MKKFFNYINLKIEKESIFKCFLLYIFSSLAVFFPLSMLQALMSVGDGIVYLGIYYTILSAPFALLFYPFVFQVAFVFFPIFGIICLFLDAFSKKAEKDILSIKYIFGYYMLICFFVATLLNIYILFAGKPYDIFVG